jgi:putative ABC transport system ATP-binding protein
VAGSRLYHKELNMSTAAKTGLQTRQCSGEALGQGANGKALISLEGITKVFYTDEVETHALSGIYLEIRRGEYLSIAGPSGCGKSTLLSILGLLDSPTEGKYRLNGSAAEDLSLSQRTRIRNREIGFIFQAFNLIGDLTGTRTWSCR